MSAHACTPAVSPANNVLPPRSQSNKVGRTPDASWTLHRGPQAELVVDAIEECVQALDGASDVLSPDEWRRAERFRFPADRQRFIAVRSRLRHLLGARLAVPPKSIELMYGVHGKPMLAPAFADADLRFNLTHTPQHAAFAFSYGGEVGVDLEEVQLLPDADDVAMRMFSQREAATYAELAGHDKPLGFFNCWTRKEAFIKALGAGLSYSLRAFDVSLAPGEPACIQRVGDTPGAHCGWTMSSFSPAPGLVGALVTRTPEIGAA